MFLRLFYDARKNCFFVGTELLTIGDRDAVARFDFVQSVSPSRPRVKHRYVSRPDIPVDRATFLKHEAQQVQRSGRCVSSGSKPGAWKSGRRTKLSSNAVPL